jgi:ferredoxin
MLVNIDRDKCIGSGACVIACPEVFGLDDDGMVRLLDTSPPLGLQGRVSEAVHACPANVISTAAE